MIDKDQETTQLGTAYGYSVNDVLKYRLGSMENLEKMDSYCSEFEKLILDGNLEKAEIVLEKMRQTFGEENTEVIRCEAELQAEKMMQEE